MAAVKFQKGSDEWKMFTDFWTLCQRFWNVENTDEYWKEFIDASNEFCEKYKEITDGIFPNKLALAILDAKEEERKNYKE